MSDFLTKKTDHFSSQNPAIEVANQLRNELYEKLKGFNTKKSPK